MAAKLIDIKEAAEILGVTLDQLGDMRSRGEIHGYRDGGSWKFKTDEVERVANARAGNDNSILGCGTHFAERGVRSRVGAGARCRVLHARNTWPMK